MKYIQLTLEDDLHKEIKLKAIQSGKTIPKYILDCLTKGDDIFYSGFNAGAKAEGQLRDGKQKETPMYKDVVEQSEETPYWKGDIKTGQMTECKETTTEPKKFKGGYTKEQSVGKKPKRK